MMFLVVCVLTSAAAAPSDASLIFCVFVSFVPFVLPKTKATTRNPIFPASDGAAAADIKTTAARNAIRIQLRGALWGSCAASVHGAIRPCRFFEGIYIYL